MEHRAIALLVAILVTFGTWQIVKPKPTSIDDPAWKCEVSAKLNPSECTLSSETAKRSGLPVR